MKMKPVIAKIKTVSATIECAAGDAGEKIDKPPEALSPAASITMGVIRTLSTVVPRRRIGAFRTR